MTLAGYENEPLRSLSTENIIDRGPQLVHSEIHHCFYAEATLLTGCSQSMTEHSRHMYQGRPIPGRREIPATGNFQIRTSRGLSELSLELHCSLRLFHPKFLSFLPLSFTWNDICISLLTLPAFVLIFFLQALLTNFLNAWFHLGICFSLEALHVFKKSCHYKWIISKMHNTYFSIC